MELELDAAAGLPGSVGGFDEGGLSPPGGGFKGGADDADVADDEDDDCAGVNAPEIVVVKLASNAATASGDKVCEKLNGGNGTDPGAGVVCDINPGYDAANLELAVAALAAYFSIASAAAWAVALLLLLFHPFTADTAAWAAAATADVCCCAWARYDCCAHSSAIFVNANNASTCTAGRSCKLSHVNSVGIHNRSCAVCNKSLFDGRSYRSKIKLKLKKRSDEKLLVRRIGSFP